MQKLSTLDQLEAQFLKLRDDDDATDRFCGVNREHARRTVLALGARLFGDDDIGLLFGEILAAEKARWPVNQTREDFDRLQDAAETAYRLIEDITQEWEREAADGLEAA